VPGFTNSFQVTPTLEGTYSGKCAELCGEFHSDMLFNLEVVSQEESVVLQLLHVGVELLLGEFRSAMLFNLEVVSQEEFDAHMQQLEDDGYTGQLGVDLNRNQEEWSMREAHEEAGPRVREEADQ